MYVGLNLEPQKKYYCELKSMVHLSQAALEVDDENAEPIIETPTKLYVKKNGETFLVASFTRSNPNKLLELVFSRDEKITIYTTNAKNRVSISGDVVPNDVPMKFTDPGN